MSLLEAREASVSRGQRLILKRASVWLAGGELVALVGPNGSGKSTLLRALAGLWPTSPREAVALDGRPVADIDRREVARRIAFVSQDSTINFAFTVEEIVRMGRYPHRGRFARESGLDREAVRLAIARCDIEHLATRAANTLSGGERQRVLIARSLAVEPRIYFARRADRQPRRRAFARSARPVPHSRGRGACDRNRYTRFECCGALRLEGSADPRGTNRFDRLAR